MKTPSPRSLSSASLPASMVALLARVAVAGVFWRSGQTKIEGFAFDLVDERFTWGWPRLSETAVALFRDEYRLPFIPPEAAAGLAALGEHALPLLLLLGLGTRWAALGLLMMTAVIQVLVYPGAWPTHGTWAAALLYLVLHGPGQIALDHWLWGKRAETIGDANRSRNPLRSVRG